MTPERLSEIKKLLDADYVLDLTYVVSECVDEIERLQLELLELQAKYDELVIEWNIQAGA